jgi:hypothetical protein
MTKVFATQRMQEQRQFIVVMAPEPEPEPVPEPTNKYLPCVHCGSAEKIRKSRGLCGSCYYRLAIRRLYPASPCCQGVGRKATGKELPTEPTEHLPGTEGKIEVMVQRAFDGVALWHPRDAKVDVKK